MVIKKKAGGKKSTVKRVPTKQTPSFNDFEDAAQEEEQQQKTHVPEEHEVPTTEQLASAKSSLMPFVASKSTVGDLSNASSSSKSKISKNRAQQLLEEDTDGAAIIMNSVDENDKAGDADDEDFESGIVLSREAHEQSQTKKDLIAEARMRRGLEVTEIADRVDIGTLALFGKKLGVDAASPAPSSNHRFWGHNRNTITCVAATPPDLKVNTKLGDGNNNNNNAATEEIENPEDIDIQAETRWSSGSKMLCCFGDKSGRTWVILDDATAEKPRVALNPPQKGPVLCVAISDAPPSSTLSNERISLVATKMERYIIAAGGSDGTIYFWSGLTLQHRGHVNLHRQPVTGLAFRAGTHTLYSVSKDAVLRVWDTLEAPARSVDKLYGHTNAALCVASSTTSFLESANTTRQTAGGGRCVSGGDDRIPRLWKIETATESEFKEPLPRDSTAFTGGSIEACCLVGIGASSSLAFVVGTSTGTLALYDANKRTPLWVQERAHGSDIQGDGTGLEVPMREIEKDLKRQRERHLRQNNKNSNNNDDDNDNDNNDNAVDDVPTSQIRTCGSGNPITAIAAVPCGDVVATGSGDGFVRLWKLTFDEGRVSRVGVQSATKVPVRLDLLCEVKTPGWVNGLSFSYSGGSSIASKNNQWYLYVTSSKEQRLGRWTVFSKVLNGVLRFPLIDLLNNNSGNVKKNNNNNASSSTSLLPHQNDLSSSDEESSEDDDEQDFESSVKAQKSMSQLRSKFLQTPEKRTMTRTQKAKLNRKQASKSELGAGTVEKTKNDDDKKATESSSPSASSTTGGVKKLSLEEKKKKLLLLRKKKLLALKKK